MNDIDIQNIRRLDGGLLLVFRELLRLQRASAVAERLGLSQPAISHALSRLRDLFQDPLFIRRAHGLEPTRRALELAPRIEALIKMADAALSTERAFDPAATKRRFIVGAPEFVTALIGGRLITQLQAEAPGATFAIVHTSEEDAYVALRTGQVDLALGRFGAARPGYTVAPLFDDHYCVVARRGHPRIAGAIDEPTWLDAGHVFAWAPSETAAEVSQPELGTGRPEPRMVAAVPHWLTVLTLVAATDGIGTVPRKLAERHADLLGLQVLDLPFPPDVITVSVLRRTGNADNGADWLVSQVRRAVDF